MYKGKRYNFIVVGLIFIMAFVVGASAGMTKVSFEEILNEGFEEEVIQEDNGEEEIPEGLQVPGTDATAFERLEFAFDIYENGLGYTSYTNQIIDIVGNIQYSVYKRYRSGTHDLSEEWYKMTGVASSYGLNKFIGHYSDGEYIHTVSTEDTKKYNFENKTQSVNKDYYSKTTTERYYNELKKVKLNSFFTTISQNTCDVLYYDAKARGKDYYTIKVGLAIEKLDENFVYQFEAKGAAGLTLNYANVTFKISKETGYLLSYEAEGTFTATYVPLNVSASVSMGIKELFYTMNKSCDQQLFTLRSQMFGL